MSNAQQIQANGPVIMGADGIMRPASARDMQDAQKRALILQTSQLIMAELTSIAYTNAINEAKILKMQNIKDKLKNENGYCDEEELNKEAVREFNLNPQLQVNFDLAMPADVAIAAAQTLLHKLSI